MAQARRKTPPPESRFWGTGAWFACAVAIPTVPCYYLQWSWGVVFLLPLALYIVHKAYGLLLLGVAALRWRGSSIQGVLVLSDSPNWKEHIEREWLPRLAGRVVVLNWSERKAWRRTLAVRLFYYFCVAGDNFNFNPALILLRGLRYPYVFRYYHAFLDAKHGHKEMLDELERRMFSELEPRPGN